MLGLCSLTAMSQETADDFFRLGIESSRQRSFDLALEYYNRTIELDPTYIKAYSMRGDILASRGDYSLGIADFTKAIQLDPKGLNSLSKRALAKLYSSDPDGAIIDCLRLIELRSTTRWAYHFIGRAYDEKARKLDNADLSAKRSEYSKAIGAYTQALAIDPTDAESFRHRSISNYRIDNYESALADISSAINIKPQFTDYYRHRLTVYEKMGRTALADADRKKIADLALTK
jgi:tetratricopeptide (TPR) repeat protein